MTLFDNKPEVMEVTLRDGSYVIDFQFTAEDTASLVAALEGAGFRWIEVGHGLGLNASDKGQRRAIASDEEHLQAAASAVKDAKWGMFFIPGIGRAEDIDLAAKYGMSFIRVGTNITDADKAEPFIKQAKAHGMTVCYNAMKSYAVKPEEFAAVAKQTRDWGADIVYIVDSAGTMMPEDVHAFVKAIQAVTDVPIGFHGHDNLSMGMANTLAAIEAGASIVDTSLRGMGRSAGNVITEALLASLQRRGQLTYIDLKQVMDVSAGMIAPLVPGRGLDTMAITAGLAGFHSSFTAKVKTYAEKYDVDIRDLIVKLCEEDRINAPDDILQRLSLQLAAEKRTSNIVIPAFSARADGDEGEAKTLENLTRRLYSEATKRRTFSTLNIVLAEQATEAYRVSNHIHNTVAHSIGSVTVGSQAQLEAVLQAVNSEVDVILLDDDARDYLSERAIKTAQAIVKATTLLRYSDQQAWIDAVVAQTVRLLDEQIQHPIVIASDHPNGAQVQQELGQLGAQVTLGADKASLANTLQDAALVIVWHKGSAWFDASLASQLRANTYVLDAGIGSLTADGISTAKKQGALPIRIDIWPTLGGILLSAHNGAIVRQSALGWGEIAGIPVVAGGAIGDEGTVIVDNVSRASRVIGVADGQGGVITHYNTTQANAVGQVLSSINTRRIEPEV